MDMKIKYIEVNLDKVLEYFQKDFEANSGREIYKIDSFVDPSKNKVILKFMMKELIKKHSDLIKFRWKVEDCHTKDCWCAIISTEEPVFWEQPPNEEAYIAPFGSIPKEIVKHIVKLHNENLKDQRNNQMKNKIHKLLNQARKDRDYSALSAYQSIYSAIQEREAKENVSLTDDQILSVIEKEQKAFKESADLFADKKPLDSKTYAIKAQICADLLPEKIDESEYENIVSESFQAVGEDMGKAMKYLKEKHGKTIDMKKISGIVREKL